MFAARVVALAAVMVSSLHVALAQSSPFAFEAGGGVSLRSALGDMSTIPGIPSPGPLTFTSVDATLHAFGYVGADVQIASWFGTGLRLGGLSTRGILTAQERVPIARADTVYRATLEHRRALDATMLSIEPFVRWAVTDHIALDIGLPLMLPVTSSYRQTQYFTDPAGLQFVDGTTEQLTGRGDVPGLRSIVTYVRTRASVDVPITRNKQWSIVAHVGAARSVASLHSSAALGDGGLDLGLSIRFRPMDAVPPQQPPQRRVDTVYVRDTVTVLQPGMASPDLILDERIVSDITEIDPTTASVTVYERYRRVLPKPPAVLDAAIRVVFVGEGGEESIDATIRARRQRDVRSVTMVPVVVYDAASTAMPTELVRLDRTAAMAFHERMALDTSSAVHWSQHIVNIVASRMRKHMRNVVVARTGGDRAVGVERVAELRTYMQRSFGIDARRIRHEHITELAADVVIFHDPSCDLLGPITRTDTVVDTKLPMVRIYPDVVSDAGVAAWQLDVAQGGKVLHSARGTGDVPPTILWTMSLDVTASEALRAPFDVALTVLDREGGKVTSDSASIMLRNAPAVDPGTALPTVGEWVVQLTSSTGTRACTSTPPSQAAVPAELDIDDATAHWAFRRLPASLRPWCNGTWVTIRSDTTR